MEDIRHWSFMFGITNNNFVVAINMREKKCVQDGKNENQRLHLHRKQRSVQCTYDNDTMWETDGRKATAK